MSKETDVLIIRGGPAGIVCAVTAKRYYPDKNVLVMKNVVNGCIPCGIPYMFWSLKNPDDNKLGLDALKKNNVEIVIDEALRVDRSSKTVISKGGEEYKYEKLVFALGSVPIKPPIAGVDKNGVYPVYKDMDYLKKIILELKKAKDVLVLGGGFIGVEFADEVSKIEDINVYLMEVLLRLRQGLPEQTFIN